MARGEIERRVGPIAEMDVEDQQLLNAAAEHYHQTLLAQPGVLRTMRWHGEVEASLIEHFCLGYADRTLAETLAPKGATRMARLKALGLICPSGRERFGGAVVVPIRDRSGNVLQLCAAFHVSSHDYTPDEYLPGVRRGVFHPMGFDLGEELILTASPLDAMRFWYAGHGNVTCSDGLLLRDEHVETMKKHSIRRVLIAYDAQPDSEQAAEEIAERLRHEGIASYRARLARRFKPTSQRWGQILKKAEPMQGAPPRPEPTPLGADWRHPMHGEVHES